MTPNEQQAAGGPPIRRQSSVAGLSSHGTSRKRLGSDFDRSAYTAGQTLVTVVGARRGTRQRPGCPATLRGPTRLSCVPAAYIISASFTSIGARRQIAPIPAPASHAPTTSTPTPRPDPLNLPPDPRHPRPVNAGQRPARV